MSLTDESKSLKKKIVNSKNSVDALKTTKIGKDIVGERHFSSSELPEASVPIIMESAPTCSVSYTKRQLVNMGNFETTAIEISASIECSEKNMNTTYTKVKEFVEGRVELEIDELYRTRDNGDFL